MRGWAARPGRRPGTRGAGRFERNKEPVGHALIIHSPDHRPWNGRQKRASPENQSRANNAQPVSHPSAKSVKKIVRHFAMIRPLRGLPREFPIFPRARAGRPRPDPDGPGREAGPFAQRASMTIAGTVFLLPVARRASMTIWIVPVVRLIPYGKRAGLPFELAMGMNSLREKGLPVLGGYPDPSPAGQKHVWAGWGGWAARPAIRSFPRLPGVRRASCRSAKHGGARPGHRPERRGPASAAPTGRNAFKTQLPGGSPASGAAPTGYSRSALPGRGKKCRPAEIQFRDISGYLSYVYSEKRP